LKERRSDMQPSVRDIPMSPREARERALGLRELRYFLSVAQTGNIGRAAQALNVTQPAISIQLRKLEENLGTQLLIRHGRGTMLTAAGACLRDRASAAVELLTQPLTPAPRDDASEMISLAVTAEMGGIVGPSLAKSFQARWPHLRLAILEGRGSTLEEWLIHGSADVAILEDPPALPELELTPMLVDSLGIVGSINEDALLDTRPLAIRELSRYPLILPRGQHWLRRRLNQVTLQRGVQLSSVFEVDSIAVIKSLVCSGVAFSILPNAAIQGELSRGVLAFRPVGQPVMTCNSSIAFRRDATDVRIAEFAEMTRDAVTALARNGAWPGTRLMHAGAA
jgi:LysR family nitrogen assimilation transcriptional regulator